jgi:hypothetical protein
MTQPSHSGGQYPAVIEVLHRYYEGLYHSDTTLLRLAFQPQAYYVTASGGELLHLGLGDYLPIVAARTPPSGQAIRMAMLPSPSISPDRTRPVCACV